MYWKSESINTKNTFIITYKWLKLKKTPLIREQFQLLKNPHLLVFKKIILFQLVKVNKISSTSVHKDIIREY